MAKKGAQRHNYTRQRGYHPLFAIAAKTGDVLMARLRERRVRHAGAAGPLAMWADSGFYTHGIDAACRDKSVRFTITVRQHQITRNIIEAVPEVGWPRPRKSSAT